MLLLWIDEQVKDFFTEVEIDKKQLIFTLEKIGKSGSFLGTSGRDASKLECTNTLLPRATPSDIMSSLVYKRWLEVL